MKTAKLFQDGDSQAVGLPKGYRFNGDHVFIKRVGDAVVLLPCHATWETLLKSLPLFSADFMSERIQLPLQIRRE